MKVFDSENIRNAAVVGHGDTGKTSLVSALLYSSGAVNRLGRVEDGNTVTDYDEDEIERKISINTALAHCVWRSAKINLLDTPGYPAFILDTKASMVAGETALVVVDAVSGVEVQTERVWGYAEEYGMPRALVMNKLDRERAGMVRSLESLTEMFGREVVPLQWPIGEEKEFRGIVDLILNQAFLYQKDGSGEFQKAEVPDDLRPSVEEKRQQLIELVAENDDELMEKYFEEGDLAEEDLLSGLRTAFVKRQIFPVFCTAAALNVGVKQLLDWIVRLFPTPLERQPMSVHVLPSREEQKIEPRFDGPAAAYVFKTLADPFTGRISMLKVASGTLKSDSTFRNFVRECDERMGSLQILQGKAHETVPEVKTGDLCAAFKLKETLTGDTLGEKDFAAVFKQVELPEPSISFAIEPKSRGDEDKISTAVTRLLEEDPTIRFRRDPQTQEFLISGMGQLHIEVIVNRLKKKFGVDVVLKLPKVPYRETITRSADVQGRHKKQTGGHGQFGDCKIRMEPVERDAGFEFVNQISGGAIPRQYIPAVEKGIQEAAARGFLAGYPVVDFRVVLYDGSYHDVDSSELAFKIAGSLAFKKAMEQSGPVILEPFMNVEVYVPEENAGDIMGEINARRGRITGMDVRGNSQVVRAQVPLAEMLNFQPSLTSITGGRGTFHMEHSHYDILPPHLTEKVIAEAEKES